MILTTLILVLISLAGCASAPIVTTVREQPPVELIQDCPQPLLDVATNGGLARSIQALKGALSLCNLDKQALRKWAESK